MALTEVASLLNKVFKLCWCLSCFNIYQNQGLYSQHFILFITWVQLARVFVPIKSLNPSVMKHSSF
jgi:hypothetical protein